MKILFLPKYDESGASSRYRTYNYLKYFSEQNITCDVYPLFKNYNINIKNNILHFSLFYTISILQRLCALSKASRYDLIYIEKELIPYFPPYLELLLSFFNKKYILDYDDAIFHKYDTTRNKLIKFLFKNKIPIIMKKASYIITGSEYLTNFALKYNKNVIEIPTSLDIEKYPITNSHQTNDNFTIGWIGGTATSIYVYNISTIFEEIRNINPNISFKLIGYDKSLSKNLPSNVEVIEWNKEIEFELLNSIHVGIMPLPDNPFEKGKCGFKLIQYMACSKLTISTPLITNINIDGGIGNLFSTNLKDWTNSILFAYNNYSKFNHIMVNNRLRVETYYSIQSNYKKYIDIFCNLNNNK